MTSMDARESSWSSRPVRLPDARDYRDPLTSPDLLDALEL